MQDPQQYVDEYRIIRRIGTGYSADVYEAELEGDKYAIKLFKPEATEFAETEYFNARMLYHPNIIGYEDHRTLAKHITPNGQSNCEVLIMEYAQNHEIYELVEKCQGFSEIVARTYFHMLIEAIQYIHDCGVSHLDIKAENLLLDESYSLKIADFGFSARNSHYIDRKVGTEGYMSPEIEANQRFDGDKADIFASGVVLFIMTTGFLPFKSTKPEDIYYRTLHSNPTRFWNTYGSRKLSSEFKDLLKKMFSLNIEDRLSIEQIKEHPWYCQDILLRSELTATINKLIKKSDP